MTLIKEFTKQSTMNKCFILKVCNLIFSTTLMNAKNKINLKKINDLDVQEILRRDRRFLLFCYCRCIKVTAVKYCFLKWISNGKSYLFCYFFFAMKWASGMQSKKVLSLIPTFKNEAISEYDQFRDWMAIFPLNDSKVKWRRRKRKKKKQEERSRRRRRSQFHFPSEDKGTKSSNCINCVRFYTEIGL